MSSRLPPTGSLTVTVFDGCRRVASGPLSQVVDDVVRYRVRAPESRLAAFDDATGEQLMLDWDQTGMYIDGQAEQAAEPQPEAPAPQIVPPSSRRAGRPRLGVVAREVTLLPEDWQWLNSQPGGASHNLRKLIAAAREAERVREATRRAHESAYRFVVAMATELPGYEDALLALYAGDASAFEALAAAWPQDLRDYVRQLGWGQRVGA